MIIGWEGIFAPSPSLTSLSKSGVSLDHVIFKFIKKYDDNVTVT